MAADILLYGASRVPVGGDQDQHVELARDLAVRFNRTYGETFEVPELHRAAIAARVRDLAHPTSKMSKSEPDDAPGWCGCSTPRRGAAQGDARGDRLRHRGAPRPRGRPRV